MPDEPRGVEVKDLGDVMQIDYGEALLALDESEARLRVLLDAGKTVEASDRQVLLCSIPRDGFSSSRVNAFWERAQADKPQVDMTRLYPSSDPKPQSLIRMNRVAEQLVMVFHRLELLKVANFSGEVDFELLGLLLAFDYRLCDEDTVFVNRVLERDTAPGFCLQWFLTHNLGRARTLDLVLRRETLTAQEALDLCLVNEVCSADSLEERSVAAARRLARCSSDTVAGLQKAARHLDLDLESFVKAVGVVGDLPRK